MRLRRASLADAGMIHRLRNAPEVRSVSLHPEPISPEGHLHWMRTTKDDVLIVRHRFRSIGYVRVSVDGEISIALKKQFRGRGLGAKAIAKGIARDPRRVYSAYVLKDNDASMRAFQKVGFEPVTRNEGGTTFIHNVGVR